MTTGDHMRPTAASGRLGGRRLAASRPAWYDPRRGRDGLVATVPSVLLADAVAQVLNVISVLMPLVLLGLFAVILWLRERERRRDGLDDDVE